MWVGDHLMELTVLHSTIYMPSPFCSFLQSLLKASALLFMPPKRPKNCSDTLAAVIHPADQALYTPKPPQAWPTSIEMVLVRVTITTTTPNNPQEI